MFINPKYNIIIKKQFPLQKTTNKSLSMSTNLDHLLLLWISFETNKVGRSFMYRYGSLKSYKPPQHVMLLRHWVSWRCWLCQLMTQGCLRSAVEGCCTAAVLVHCTAVCLRRTSRQTYCSPQQSHTCWHRQITKLILSLRGSQLSQLQFEGLL